MQFSKIHTHTHIHARRILTVRIVFPWSLSGEKAPRIDMDKIPKEIKVDAGDVIDLNIPCIALPPPKVKLLIDGEEESTWKMRIP